MADKQHHEVTLFTEEQAWIVAAIADKKRKPFSGEFEFNGQKFTKYGLATTEDKFRDKVFDGMVVSITKVDRKDLAQMLVDVLNGAKEAADA